MAILGPTLHILRADHGAVTANRVARQMLAPPHQVGGQAQYVETPVSTGVRAGERLGAALEWAVQRLALAQRLLVTTDQPIEQVAAGVGFGTPAALRLHFRNALATSPAEYRRTFRVAPAS